MKCKNRILVGTNQSTTIISKFIYNITIDRTYNKQQCVCSGRHPDPSMGYNKNVTITFHVYFAPNAGPVISGYTNNEILYEPEKKVLICKVSGGNHVATISWRCRGKAVDGANQTVDGEARSTIKLEINRDFNDKDCKCTTVHPADNYNKQTSVTFTVYYIDLIPVASELAFDKTFDIRLSVLTSGNYMGVTFLWKQEIGSNSIRTLNGSYTNSTSDLIIPYSSYQDTGTYTCYAYNSKGKIMTSKDIVVTVKDNPVIAQTITAQEKKSNSEMFVDFYSVPKPLKVKWLIEGSIISLSEKFRQSNTIAQIRLTFHDVKVHLEGYRAKLSITGATDADHGVYLLRIENSIGVAKQIVNFQQKVESKDLPVVEISIGIFALLVLITAVATIFICIRRRKTSQNNTVQMDVINGSKYEELQAKKEENDYNLPKTQAGSDFYTSVYCEAIQTTDNTSTYDEIRMSGNVMATYLHKINKMIFINNYYSYT